MSYDDLMNPPKEELSVSESFLVNKLDELLPAMIDLLTRVKILEQQVAFLLSKDPEYVAALEKYVEKEIENESEKRD